MMSYSRLYMTAVVKYVDLLLSSHRYDNSDIYTYVGSILVSVNPYRMFNPLYGLDAVSKYDGQIIGTLPPHLFAVGASAYHRMLAKDGEKQVRVCGIPSVKNRSTTLLGAPCH